MKDLIFNIYKTLFFFDLSLIVMSVIPDIKTNNSAYLRLWQEIIPFIVIFIFTLVFVRVIEQKRIRIPVRIHKVKFTLKGLFWGILIIVPTVVIMVLLKAFAFSGSNKVSYLIVWIIAILLNTVTYELLLRGYLYQLYRSYYSLMNVITVNTLLFISLNLKIFNNGIIYVLNMLVMNILLCLMLEYTKSLLIPIAAHFAYNLISTVLLGSLKLTNDYPFLLNCSFPGKKFLSGGEMKIEGSICLLTVELIFAIVLIIKLNKRKKTNHSGRRINYYGR